MVFPYKISPKIYKIGRKEARMADYQPVALQTVFDVTAVVNLSYYRLPQDYAFSGEQHPFWEFLYVDRGSVVVTAGADRYQLHAGELAFHRPDEFHSFRAMGEANIFVVSFCCASPAMHRLEEKVLRLHQREKQSLRLLLDEAALAYEHFEGEPPIVNLAKRADAPWGSDQLIKVCLEQFLICITRRDDTIQFSQRAVTEAQLQQRQTLAQQACDYLAVHYADKITLASLAAALGVSVSQLKRVFREQVGKTAVHYLNALRVQEAKRLIRRGELNFTQIAERVGIESIYYFSNLFKKYAGISPSEYAKSLKS